MTITNPLHFQILGFLKKSKSNFNSVENQWVKRYLGSNKPTYGIKTIKIRNFAKKIIEKNNLDGQDLINLLNSLYQKGATFNEIDMASKILGIKTKFCANLDPNILDNWLNYTYGWAEVDCLCQSNFTQDILLSNWSVWESLLSKFNKDSNIHKRRASLVLLNKSLNQSNDSRLLKLAFRHINNLKFEKEVLITKAVSWSLRSLIKFHKNKVLEYLEKNKDHLPKITYREVLTKATTGRKYNNSKNKNMNFFQ